MMENSGYLLKMRGIEKRYPGVHALRGVDFAVQTGEVHALVGENGAGKSTLMKILAGVESMDSGDILFQGQSVSIQNPQDALDLGIAIIYQEFNLVSQLSAAENIFLGREPGQFGFVHFSKMKQEALRLLESLGLSFDVTLPVERLSIAEQQMVEIAKALSVQSKIIVMDEPSATLTQRELDCLYSIIASLKSRGISVVYISHRLEEIFTICDRLTVLRDGEWIRTLPVHETDRQGIIEMMVGRSITDEFPKEKFVAGDVLLQAEGLSCGKVKDVSLEVRSGEIVGLTGLVGSGRTEAARLLFGADKRKSGDLQWLGKTVDFSSPREAIKAGICFLTEDRKTQGLVLGMNVRENISLPTLQEFTRFLFVDSKKEKRVAGESIEELNIKTPSAETSVNSLSGGNQQKVVLAKWLLSQAKLFIFDEPTRGIDVGAKREIYILMNELLRRGAGILMISSELPEVLGMSDRVLVMSEGHLVCELSRDEASQEAIMHAATQQCIPV